MTASTVKMEVETVQAAMSDEGFENGFMTLHASNTTSVKINNNNLN